MNDLQKTEFELLKVFISVCQKLNLKYYLVCGSVLGVVKYKGFIPWDDDIDVGLFREDYERFISEAPALLPEWLFLQNYKSDPKFPHIFSKLRDSRTTYIEKTVSHLDMNHGVYIDVFPLDGYPDDASSQTRLERMKKSYQRKLSCVFRVKRTAKSLMGYLYRRARGYHKQTNAILSDYTLCISAFPTANSHVICNHGNWQGRLEYAPREQYGDGVMMEFEGIEVRVPELYDEYLTQKYGDWRADLPAEQQQGHHYFSVCDLSRPYTYYFEN